MIGGPLPNPQGRSSGPDLKRAQLHSTADDLELKTGCFVGGYLPSNGEDYGRTSRYRDR